MAEEEEQEEEEIDEQESKWWWLRTNRFFELTPLSGYAFILTSKSVVETGFWYLLIVVFTGITVNNVYSASKIYMSKPTRTYVQPVAITKNVRLANFTLTLKLSMLEASPEYPVVETVQDRSARGEAFNLADYPTLRDYYSCDNPLYKYSHAPDDFSAYMQGKMGNTYRYLWSVVQTMLGGTAGEQTDEDYYYDDNYKVEKDDYDAWSKTTPLTIEKAQDLIKLSSNSTLKQWKEVLAVKAQELKDYWDANKGGAWAMNPGAHATLKDLVNAPFDEHIWQTVLKLLISQVFKENDVDGLVRHFTTDSATIASYNRKTGDDIMAKVADITNDDSITTADVINDAINGISKMLHIDLKNEENGEVFFDLVDYTYKSQKNNMVFKFLVTVPENVTVVELELRSFRHMWFLHILNILYEAGDNLYCDSLNKLEQFNSFEMQQEIYNALRTYYLSTSSLKIETHRGNSIIMTPFQSHYFKIKPTGRFNSRIDNCYMNSYEYCLADCINTAYLDTCQCYRWDQMYLNKGGSAPPCTTICTDADEKTCEEDCVKFVEHPCDMSIYQIEQNTLDFTVSELLDPNSPLFTFGLEREQVFNHPVFIEEYQMTLPMFMSELGGLIELWSGINVIGVIHIIIYGFKQVRHARDPTTKTGRTVRRLLGRPDPLEKSKIDESMANENKDKWTKITKKMAPVIDIRMAALEKRLMMAAKGEGGGDGEKPAAAEEKPKTSTTETPATEELYPKESTAASAPKPSKGGWGKLNKIAAQESLSQKAVKLEIDGEDGEQQQGAKELVEMRSAGTEMQKISKSIKKEMDQQREKTQAIMKGMEQRLDALINDTMVATTAELKAFNEANVRKALVGRMLVR